MQVRSRLLSAIWREYFRRKEKLVSHLFAASGRHDLDLLEHVDILFERVNVNMEDLRILSWSSMQRNPRDIRIQNKYAIRFFEPFVLSHSVVHTD